MKILKAAYLRCSLLPHWRALGCKYWWAEFKCTCLFCRKNRIGPRLFQAVRDGTGIGRFELCVGVCIFKIMCVSLSATGLPLQHGIDNMRVPSRCPMWYCRMRSLWIYKQELWMDPKPNHFFSLFFKIAFCLKLNSTFWLFFFLIFFPPTLLSCFFFFFSLFPFLLFLTSVNPKLDITFWFFFFFFFLFIAVCQLTVCRFT